jgi:hypothetical protein
LFTSFSSQAQESFLTVVPTANALSASIPDDYYVAPWAATASNYQSSEPISRSYDRDMSTLYHSSWSNTFFPVTLTYRFRNQERIDYVIYYPRTSGSNGNFKEVEVWYSLTDDKVPAIKYGTYNLNGSGSPYTFNFSEGLVNPDTIRFVVLSGAGDNATGYASCAEMEFYRRNPEVFDYTGIFADKACSELRPEVNEDSIKAIPQAFFQKLASDLYHNKYDAEFKVQEYEARQTPEIIAALNKTNKYGLRDNPTGIYAIAGEDLIVIVGETDGHSPSLFIQEPWKEINGTAYALREGVNKITPKHEGLVYILYYTATGEEDPVKINIVTGGVNGYFDVEKHTTPEEWRRLLAKANYSFWDVKGRYSILILEPSAWRTGCPNDGAPIIEKYDDLVYSEQVFQGMEKYNKMNPTRMVLIAGKMSTGVAANASDYRTAYGDGSQVEMVTMSKLTSTTSTTGAVAWMPAHEIGHVNQTRPGLKWQGMTEVTNNILSQYITTKWGIRSRLGDEIVKNGKTRYQIAVEEIVDAGLAHNAHGDVFCKLVPFWQLKLYMHDVLGEEDFYKDVYEEVRLRANPAAQSGSTSDGMCQLQFVKIACEIAQLDLTDFFEKWGFLTAVSMSVDDYGTSTFTVTQTAIDAVKAEIAAKGYPQPTVPAGKKLYEITDKNKNEYKVGEQ